MSTGEVYYADDGTMSMVLDAKVDPKYEPTHKELEEYAQWLGIDLDTEKELMFLAREGLKAPLPEEWKPCKTDTGDVYYFNFSSGESIWEHPLDEHFKSRLEEERAKLRAGLKVGPSDDGKKKKKEKKEEKKKLEKGAAGNDPSSAPSAKPEAAGTTMAPPKGRLGALGADNATNRPDISGLVPTSAASTIPKSFALPSKEVSSKDTAAEDDQRLKDTLRTEHDDHIRKLKEQQDEKMAESKAVNARELSRLEKDLASKHEDEVDDTARAAERRTRRELQMYTESIDRQLDDLRRTLKQERLRRDAEAEAIDARVENELSAKRKAADAKIDADASKRVADLHTEWHTEQNQLTAATDRAISSFRSDLEAQTASRQRKEADSVAQRLALLDEELAAEERAVQQQLAATHHEAIAEHNAGSAPGERSSEYAAAEERYAQAIAESKADAAKRGAEARERFAAQKAAATEAHRRQMDAATSGAAEQLDAAKAATLQKLKAEAEERSAAALTASGREQALAESAFEEETASMCDTQRTQALASVAQEHQAAAQEVARISDDLNKEHTDEIKALNAAHAERLARVRDSAAASADAFVPTASASTLESRRAKWSAEHPDPPRTSDGDTASELPDADAVRQKVVQENQSRLDALKVQMAAERRQAVDAHRRKAVTEMESRVENYASERRQRRAQPTIATSPQRRVVAATQLSRDSERALADERARLQANLDALALELASANHPPRPSSALGASRDLPNLRSSGSSRLPSAPTSPERHGHHAHDAHAVDPHAEDQQRRARRVQKAKERIRTEKQVIRQRQAELEAARSEWRRDMRDAKDRGDRKQQQLLHVAKGVLEERARVLNRDTADLRQSMEMVKEEERRAGLRDSSDGARVYDMLKAIATKVEHVEARLAHSGSGRQRPSSPRRETSEKWHRYMRPSSASGSRHVDVEGWLEETAP